MWAVATGYKKGRKARYSCWLAMFVDWTSVPLVIIALQILKGQVTQRGVFPPEGCFELAPFLEEVKPYVPEAQRSKALLNEQLEWLEG